MPNSSTPNSPYSLDEVEAIRSGSIRLSDKHKVEFTFRVGNFDVAWEPDIPTASEERELQPAFLHARNLFLEQVSALLGIQILAVELDGSVHATGKASQ